MVKLIFTKEDLENLKERNCSNCYYRNEKYKILACRLHNRQVKPDFCCQLHWFGIEEEAKIKK